MTSEQSANPGLPETAGITVTAATFATEVLAASRQRPIVVDFFATWCGPCQMLKPMLEKLTAEYNIPLAKVDIDAEPELAQTYGVQGVPDVRVVLDGQVQEGFVGMLTEPKLRQFLENLSRRADLSQRLDALFAEAEAGQIDSAETKLKALLAEYPNDAGLLLEAANFYLEAGQPTVAETLLGRISLYDRTYAERADGLRALIQFKQILQTEPASELDRLYHTAVEQALAQDYETALVGFLAIVQRDRLYRQDGARKAMLTVFNLLGADHPLTRDYRKQLTMALY
jgi:putative thioredoxin